MRESGILMPVSSLPGAGGIGCFGKEAYHFVDFLAKAGQSIWQILPLSPTGYGDSPYQSCSAFAGNPYFIDLETLRRDGLLKKSDYAGIVWGEKETSVDYGALYNARFDVLRTAYKNWKAGKELPGAAADLTWDDFSWNNGHWLGDYALYMAIKTEEKMLPWAEWPAALKNRDGAALEEFRRAHEAELGFWHFVQYVFYRQWTRLKKYANEKGVQIMGDLPIYVAADSADAWAGGPLFERGPDGGFARVAGCPPDYFSADGQLWGNPLYDWAYHERTNYAWWVQRVRSALQLYDRIRIDHFRGFDTYWAIPAGSDTARPGKWEQGPGMKLFRALAAQLGEVPIVAEDLGELFPSVRQLLADSGFPGMKVLQFAFGGGDNEYLPHNCLRNYVVYPGTHDNTTLEDWWKHGATPAEKKNVTQYLALEKGQSARVAILRAALASACDTAIIPMSDWLGLGREARLNSPGVLGGNWCWRAAGGFDSPALAKEIRAMCETYCRVH